MLPEISFLAASRPKLTKAAVSTHPLGKYIQLDLRHLGEKKILERLPGIRSICIDFIGIDPVKEPIPIMPSQHYSMGGIDVNEKGASEIKGFYAAGECACVSVHGANRLGGNSLLDTIVFGKLAAQAIDKELSGYDLKPEEKYLLKLKEDVEKKINRLTKPGGERPYKLAADLGAVMSEKVGIFRTKDELAQALDEVIKIKERYKNVSVSSTDKHMNYELHNALELDYMLEVAHTIVLGALLRRRAAALISGVISTPETIRIGLSIPSPIRAKIQSRSSPIKM